MVGKSGRRTKNTKNNRWTKILQKEGSGCVAQLVEWLLPIPEVRGPNPVIGKIY